jgi:hypothetical protein
MYCRGELDHGHRRTGTATIAQPTTTAVTTARTTAVLAG